MKSRKSDQLNEILNMVSNLEYSKENVVEIISLFKKSIMIAKNINKHRSKNPLLNALLITKDKEYSELVIKDISDDDRKEAFEEFKINFTRDLSMNL